MAFVPKRRAVEGPKAGQRWVVCIDGSEFSKRAIDWTLAHMNTTPEGNQPDSLVLLYVIEQVESQFANPSEYYQGLMKQLNEESEKHARQVVQDVLAAHADVFTAPQHAPFSFETVYLESRSAKQAIVEFTSKNDVDNLVLGRRSMGDQERKLLGSTTDFCLHHAHANVIIVK